MAMSPSNGSWTRLSNIVRVQHLPILSDGQEPALIAHESLTESHKTFMKRYELFCVIEKNTPLMPRTLRGTLNPPLTKRG